MEDKRDDRPSSRDISLKPSSSKSRESKQSITDTVSQLTVEALRQFRQSSSSEDVVNLNEDEPQAGEDEEQVREGGELQYQSEDGGIVALPNFTFIPARDAFGQDADNATNEEDVQDSGMDAGAESESNDEEDDLIVLDPDHPLMQRFQTAYKDHLVRQNEKLQLELQELNEAYNHRKKERENIGVELYGIQQELARQQMLLEKEHDLFNDQKIEREQFEARLNEVRTIYREHMEIFAQNRKKTSELQTEVENLANKLRLVENSKIDVRSDIAVMKRAAEKTGAELQKAEEQKKKQDLLVDRLVQRVEHLQEDIDMYGAQLIAQKEETRANAKALSEATTELEAIELEKKQLLQQWNSSLIGMKRRDEAQAAIQEAVSLQVQHIMSIDTELEGYKRQIKKAQEQNEQLTYMQNRIETEIAMVKKRISICQNKVEALKIQYSTYSRTLHETEQQLNRTTTEVTLKENEIAVVRKQIEREFLEKMRLQDDILEKMREQLTADKASQYTKRISQKVRRRATEMERAVADVENQISKDILESENVATSVRQLRETLKDIQDEMQKKNDTISKIESEMVKKNAVVEKNQGTIDQYNKKIDQLLSKEGEDYAGPLELQIATLQKQIDAKIHECLDLQQYWLRQQGELVRSIKEVAAQSKETESLRKQSTILQQKKMRLEGEIESEGTEIRDLKKSIAIMQFDMGKLNSLIYKNSGKYESLHQDNVLLENNFMWTLKDSELESIRLQNSIEELKEEKERLTNALVEAERQIMLWEKKTQLAREARNAVDSEVGQGEIHAMKAEIHRMEVRHAQLMRQQEKMIQDMEKSVFRRECIVVRGDAQAKSGKSKLTKMSFQKNAAELRKKIKQSTQDANECEREITRLREEQQVLSQKLEEKQAAGHDLQASLDAFESDIHLLTETRHRNLADIVAKQQRAKYMSSLKDGKYTRICKSAQGIESEEEKQRDRFQSLLTIVDRLNVEYPALQTALRKITLSLGSRGIES